MDSPRNPEQVLGDLAALDVPADLDRVETLLRELAVAMDGLDALAIAKHREAAVQKLAGKELRAPASLVDSAFAALRSAGGQGSIQGDAIDLVTPEPWPDAVRGADLLEQLVAAVARYLVIVPHAVVAVALWVIHTHALDAAWITPRLAIWSPVKRCAKTLLLELLELLAPKPLIVANVTAAALFRGIEQYRPTLLIDEADTFLGDRDELRGILNSGHRRNGKVLRAVGDQHEVRAFSTYAPVAIAMIGRLPDTLADRSISIPMRRKKRTERVETLRADRCGPLEALQRKACRWALDHWNELAAADPEVPGQLHDREADNWRPLLAIADAAGGPWPDRAREAAVALSASVTADDQDSPGSILLGDLRAIFEVEDAPTIFTDHLLAKLHALHERPWAEWGKGRPLTAVQLAALLRPFGIRPKHLRIGEKTTRGYERLAFEDAFARYLPPLDLKHLKQINRDGAFGRSATRNAGRSVSGRKAAKNPVSTGVVSGVSGRGPGAGSVSAASEPSAGRSPASTDEVTL
jgi:putative DNA primase/helicase